MMRGFGGSLRRGSVVSPEQARGTASDGITAARHLCASHQPDQAVQGVLERNHKSGPLRRSQWPQTA